MRLKLDARARRILRRMPVVNVYSVVELALLAGLAVQCARLAWTIVTPITPLGDWRPAAPMVVGSPADILRGFDPFFRLGGAAGAPATVLPPLIHRKAIFSCSPLSPAPVVAWRRPPPACPT